MQLIGGLTVGAARVTAPCHEWPMVLYRMGVFSHGSVSLYLHTAPPSKVENNNSIMKVQVVIFKRWNQKQ
jgi:hypothetical protein